MILAIVRNNITKPEQTAMGTATRDVDKNSADSKNKN